MKLYIVNAQFNSYDSYYDYMIGIFDDPKMANYQKEKWTKFFTEKYDEIFTPFANLRDEDGDLPDETESDYYKKQSEYRLIFDYESIQIREWLLNTDWLDSEIVRFHPSELTDMMKSYSLQEDREMNITKIFENNA